MYIPKEWGRTGAAGVVPAVLRYYERFCPRASRTGVYKFLLTAGAIGSLCGVCDEAPEGGGSVLDNLRKKGRVILGPDGTVNYTVLELV